MSERATLEAPPPMEELEKVQSWAQEKVRDGEPDEIAKYQAMLDSLNAIIGEARRDEVDRPVIYGRERGGE